jgi:IS30 family transposase
MSKQNQTRDRADKLVALYKAFEQRAVEMRTNLTQIAIEADEKLGTSSLSLLKREFSSNNNNASSSSSSAFVVVLSDIYQVDRQKQDQQVESLKWVAPATFQRKTIKYW